MAIPIFQRDILNMFQKTSWKDSVILIKLDLLLGASLVSKPQN